MRVLLLKSEHWRDMGLARALDHAPGIVPVLEQDLGDQTWSKSMATVILVSEGSVRSDAARSLPAIRRKFPKAKVLVHGEQNDASAIANLLAQGADGYFALSLGEEKLVKAVRTIAHGSVWMPREVMAPIVSQLRSGSTPADRLSAAENTLLRMLGDGLSNKEMAAQLSIAEITVKTRLARLCRKLGVRTRLQLLSFAVRNDLLPRP
jgi:DNA-binding NarL/FixJ family response regulator